jgi:hypothetical protein
VQKDWLKSPNRQATSVLDLDTKPDDGLVEDADANPALGNRKQKGANGLIPKDQAAGLIKEASKEGRKMATEIEKPSSLKNKVKLDLNVQVKLDAHMDGVRRIVPLVYTSHSLIYSICSP